MKLSRKNRIAINIVMISISLFVWVLLLINPGQILTIEHCQIPICGLPAETFPMLLETNFPSQLIGWGLMVVAMMLPKLILPIQLIYLQSFKHYRFSNALFFVFGYVLAWMAAGVFMVAAIMWLKFLMPLSYIPALAVFFIAVLWEFSPLKQWFLNLGHAHRILPAFGWKVSRDSLIYGITHGIWCIGSGWALMLFPMLLPEGHNLAMVIVTFIMLSEHLEHPRLPQWYFGFRLKLLKIIIAQTRIRLRQVLYSN